MGNARALRDCFSEVLSTAVVPVVMAEDHFGNGRGSEHRPSGRQNELISTPLPHLAVFGDTSGYFPRH